MPQAARTSFDIKRKPAANLWHGFNFADDIGKPLNKPLNTFVTINFTHTECPEGHGVDRFMRLIDRYFGPWWRRPSRKLNLGPQGAPVYLWVAENASNHFCIHWVVHIPPHRLKDFRQWIEKIWLRSCTASHGRGRSPR